MHVIVVLTKPPNYIDEGFIHFHASTFSVVDCHRPMILNKSNKFFLYGNSKNKFLTETLEIYI